MPLGFAATIAATYVAQMAILGSKEIISGLWNYDKELKELKQTLKEELHKLEQTLLGISEMNPIQTGALFSSEWLGEIEEFWYKMYDLKDEPESHTEYLNRSLKNCIATIVDMQNELEFKQTTMKRVLTQTQDQSSSSQNATQQGLSTLWVEDKALSTLWAEDKEAIIKKLKEADSWGVTIVGICGSGKTLLALAVAKDERITDRFHIIHAPRHPKFRKDSVKQHIKDNLSDDPEKNGRVLILLDGLQQVDPTQWSDFCNYCNGELHSESKVLVTTQEPQIADVTGTDKYLLANLSDDECFTVILDIARKNKNLNDLDVKAITTYKEKLVKKCMGLPLLAHRIGALLSAARVGERQKTAVEIIRKDLWTWEEFGSVLGKMTLVSLLQEKPFLKWCLNYCSLFPPDTEFSKDLLLQLWMAEGLIPKSKEEENFMYLLSHSIFQSSDNSPPYEMHPLAYDFAQNVSYKAFYRKDIGESSHSTSPGNSITDNTRHFSLRWKNRSSVRNSDDCSLFTHSRNNRIQNSQETAVEGCLLGDIREKCKCFSLCWKKRSPVRTPIQNGQETAVEGCLPAVEGCLLGDIGEKCKGLRTFLLVRSSNTTGQIILENPTFFQSLERLRVLDISNTNLTELPQKTFLKLGYLCYLDLSFTLITSVPSLSNNLALKVLKLNGCKYLRTLPKELVRLTDLLYFQLDIANHLGGMPPGMGQLKNLRGLKVFIVGKTERVDGQGIEQLKEMNDLREPLKIAMLENVQSGLEAREAELHKKFQLKTLNLHWSVDSTHAKAKEVLEGLKPPQDLTELRIINYSGSEFPEWLSRPDVCLGLNTIKLEDCKGCSKLPPLGELPLLKHIHLRGMIELAELPVLPSTLKSLTIDECSDVLKRRCLDVGADWRKIKDLVVTIDSERVPHQSSSTQDSSNDEHDSSGQNFESGGQHPFTATYGRQNKGKQKVDEGTDPPTTNQQKVDEGISSSQDCQVPHRANRHRDENYSGNESEGARGGGPMTARDEQRNEELEEAREEPERTNI